MKTLVKIITAIFFINGVVTAQEIHIMSVYKSGKLISSRPVSEIDSVIFYKADNTIHTQYVVEINPGDNVNEKISTYRDSCLYLFHAGDYNMTEEIYLNNYSDIIFRGEEGAKLIFNNPASIFCIQMVADLHNIIIDNLEICTPDTAIANAQNKHGIASYTGANNISNLTISNCYLHTLNAGIGPASTLFGNVSDIKIINNRIENIVGYSSGRGYGIVNCNARNVLISGNTIINTGRHAIYQGLHQGDDIIIIEDNYIENTDSTFTNPNPYAAQLVVARSNNITVRNNTIANSRTMALSVEYDPLYCPTYLVNNITLQNNHIQNANFYGIWLSSLSEKPLLDCNEISVGPSGDYILVEYSAGYDTTTCSY